MVVADPASRLTEKVLAERRRRKLDRRHGRGSHSRLFLDDGGPSVSLSKSTKAFQLVRGSGSGPFGDGGPPRLRLAFTDVRAGSTDHARSPPPASTNRAVTGALKKRPPNAEQRHPGVRRCRLAAVGVEAGVHRQSARASASVASCIEGRWDCAISSRPAQLIEDPKRLCRHRAKTLSRQFIHADLDGLRAALAAIDYLLPCKAS